MKRPNILLLCMLYLWVSTEVQAFPDPGLELPGSIEGQVFDEDTNRPIEYATIVVHNAGDGSLVTGTISDPDGNFEIGDLAYGNYYVIITFIGYKEQKYDKIEVSSSEKLFRMGKVLLQKDALLLNEVEIIAQHHNIDYQIDKKVIAVNQLLTSASMSAVEVLENVPSIRVDIEGNVSLRGSTGITVLIDGKPTILDASDVLSQIPASTIQSIEIITNPSAKYEPDGTGGIINVITRKNRNTGLQGIINASTNTFGMYSGDFLLNYNTGKANFFISGLHGNQPRFGAYKSERRTTQNDTTTYIVGDGEYERTRKSSELKFGVDWDVNPRNNFSLEYSLGDRNHLSSSRQNYSTSRNIDDFVLEEVNTNENYRGGGYQSLTGNYLHRFNREKHQLQMQASINSSNGDEYAENFLLDETDRVNGGTRSTEAGPSSRLDIKMDYSLPVRENDMIEAGFQLRSDFSKDITDFYLFDNSTDGFILQEDYGNDTRYNRNIYAGYGMYRGEWAKFGYQLGLRTEYTYRETTTARENASFLIDRWDAFPTLHLSYQLPDDQQIMTSYSRRIDRPRSYFLEPFLTWSDLFNVRRGNPELLPEYIDGLELSYIKQWEEARFSLETYYRIQYNKIERFSEVYDVGVLLSTFENVGTDYSLGLESMFNMSFFPWWDFTAMGNIYDYRIKGEREGQSFEFSSFNWSSRWDNTFRVAKNLRFQFNGQYNSPTVTSQGRSLGYAEFNGAVRADFFNGKLSAVLQVRDIFRTHKHTWITEDSNFYNYQVRTTDGPIVSLSLSYKINNFKPDEGKGKGQPGGEMEGGGEME